MGGRSSNQTCTLETNIDFAKANAFFRRRTDVLDATLTPAYLLSYIAETRKHLTYAGEFSADLAVSAPISIAATCKFKNLIERRGASETQIQAFEDLVFRDSRCIREAVNSGERTFGDAKAIPCTRPDTRGHTKKLRDPPKRYRIFCKDL